MRLLYDYYVIHIPCLSLRYSFDNPSEWYRGGIGNNEHDLYVIVYFIRTL